MQTATTKWLLALTLALILAAPGFTWGEVTRGAGAAQQGQFAPPPIQVIRRVKVGGAYPVEEGVKNGSQKQGTPKNQTKAKSDPKRALKIPPVKARALPVRSIPIRSTPIRSTPIRATAVRPTSVRVNAIRSTPIRSVPLRLNGGRA